MLNYKEQYYTLFNEISKEIEQFRRAQQATERMYIHGQGDGEEMYRQMYLTLERLVHQEGERLYRLPKLADAYTLKKVLLRARGK